MSIIQGNTFTWIAANRRHTGASSVWNKLGKFGRSQSGDKLVIPHTSYLYAHYDEVDGLCQVPVSSRRDSHIAPTRQLGITTPAVDGTVVECSRMITPPVVTVQILCRSNRRSRRWRSLLNMGRSYEVPFVVITQHFTEFRSFTVSLTK